MIDLLQSQRSYLAACQQTIANTPAWLPEGQLTRVTGLVMEAVGLRLPVGSACEVQIAPGHKVEAEVVGFAGDKLFLMPVANIQGLLPGTPVRPARWVQPPAYGQQQVKAEVNGPLGRQVPVGLSLLGRVLDSLGRPLDG